MSNHKNLYIVNGRSYTNLMLLLTENFSKHFLGYFTNTYIDEGFTMQEDKPRRRSLEDLLVMARTYFPKTTSEELAKTLAGIGGMRALFCPNIQKIVFVKDNHENSKFAIYGEINEKGLGQYSGLDIYKLAGIPII